MKIVSFQLQTLEYRLCRSQTDCFRRQPTAGNSNIVTQTGSTFISESMTDIAKIPTAKLRFSTTVRSMKVSATSDWHIDRQPEIVIQHNTIEVLKAPSKFAEHSSETEMKVTVRLPSRSYPKLSENVYIWHFYH